MNEHFFRVLLGAALIIMLAGKWELGVYAYIGLMLFEGITNQRVPLLLSRIRGSRWGWTREPAPVRIPFDAERAWRPIIALLLIISFVLLPEALWFVPWFLGIAFFMAGVTGVCPIIIALERIGFRA